jgi:hypothetical protein
MEIKINTELFNDSTSIMGSIENDEFYFKYSGEYYRCYHESEVIIVTNYKTKKNIFHKRIYGKEYGGGELYYYYLDRDILIIFLHDTSWFLTNSQIIAIDLSKLEDK